MLPESLYSYLNLESTKTNTTYDEFKWELYSYLNLESTKTHSDPDHCEASCTVT